MIRFADSKERINVPEKYADGQTAAFVAKNNDRVVEIVCTHPNAVNSHYPEMICPDCETVFTPEATADPI